MTGAPEKYVAKSLRKNKERNKQERTKELVLYID
jgi:hypothetical protein